MKYTSKFMQEQMQSTAEEITVTKLPKITPAVMDALCNVSELKRLDFFKKIRAFKSEKVPITFYATSGLQFTINVLKRAGIEITHERVKKETNSDLPEGMTVFEYHRNRLNQFPDLCEFITKKRLIMKFCMSCDCKNWNSIANAFEWENTEQGEQFWEKVQKQYRDWLDEKNKLQYWLNKPTVPYPVFTSTGDTFDTIKRPC